jgi:hypothetical protein
MSSLHRCVFSLIFMSALGVEVGKTFIIPCPQLSFACLDNFFSGAIYEKTC